MSRAFVDVDTQIDFLFPAGALYVRGAERIVKRVAALNHWAASQGIPVISTVCAHAENDPEFREWPPHCVVGTIGHQKPAITLLDKRCSFPNGDTTGAQQILFHKQTVNVWENPHWPVLLSDLGATEFVVYGVVSEICVKNAVEGLLARGSQVTVVEDAIQPLSTEAAKAFLQGVVEKGGKLVTADTLVGS
jgi:nicotinamidase/pyrazinamidase